MNEIEKLIKQVLAIETLEYYDKNNLSGDNESRSRKKMELLNEVINKLKSLK